MVKKGDTLIEVTLAVGIFSMVAISVIAVMVSGTANTQTALETTLAREEIDTQAEALRFIHSAYLADKTTDTGGISSQKDPFSLLWDEIIKNAYTPNGSARDATFQQYNPTTCQEIYDNASSGALSKAFVINPHALAGLTATTINKAYISYSANSSKFQRTLTYPRLIFSAAEENNTDSLVNNYASSNLYRAEGIYVLAVADPKSTSVVGAGRSSAYYDFYIRTCWYGTSSNTPSTISTVIRLYNPKGVAK